MDRDKDYDSWEKVKKSVYQGTLKLGPYYSYQLLSNTRHLLISFARYKFAARMLGDSPRCKVLELGCSEGLGTLHLAQVAAETTAVDFDEQAINWSTTNLERENLHFIYDDFLGKVYGNFDALVSLDVIEHLEKEKEELFLETVLSNLNDKGFTVIGTPNITAAIYASEASRIGHINLYDHQRLKDLFLKGFKNVFLFGMNDELVHTGFLPMCHYLMILACNKR